MDDAAGSSGTIKLIRNVAHTMKCTNVQVPEQYLDVDLNSDFASIRI